MLYLCAGESKWGGANSLYIYAIKRLKIIPVKRLLNIHKFCIIDVYIKNRVVWTCSSDLTIKAFQLF